MVKWANNHQNVEIFYYSTQRLACWIARSLGRSIFGSNKLFACHLFAQLAPHRRTRPRGRRAKLILLLESFLTASSLYDFAAAVANKSAARSGPLRLKEVGRSGLKGRFELSPRPKSVLSSSSLWIDIDCGPN